MREASFMLILVFNVIISANSQVLHPTGQKLSRKAVKAIPLKQDARFGLAGIPESFSLKQYAPEVASQPYGNCYAYASVYAARTILYNINTNETANPGRNIFSTGFIEKLIFGSNQRRCRNRGADTFEACRLMQEVGVVPRADFPGDCTNQVITDELRTKASGYKITANSLFPFCSASDIKINSIKVSLAASRPVIIGINSVTSFHKNGGDPDLWQPTESEKNLISCRSANHAVCIIAYDNAKYGGAFEIQNSWGADWKGDGRIWIKYNDLADFIMFAIELNNN